MLLDNQTTLLLIIVWAHWVADFVFQSDRMAKNKSKSIKWLGAHITTYTVILGLVFGWEYALVNGAAHFVIDYVTSRINSLLWAKGKVHNFFVSVGFDQALHLSILFLTIPLIRLTF